MNYWSRFHRLMQQLSRYLGCWRYTTIHANEWTDHTGKRPLASCSNSHSLTVDVYHVLDWINCQDEGSKKYAALRNSFSLTVWIKKLLGCCQYCHLLLWSRCISGSQPTNARDMIFNAKMANRRPLSTHLSIISLAEYFPSNLTVNQNYSRQRSIRD